MSTTDDESTEQTCLASTHNHQYGSAPLRRLTSHPSATQDDDDVSTQSSSTNLQSPPTWSHLRFYHLFLLIPLTLTTIPLLLSLPLFFLFNPHPHSLLTTPFTFGLLGGLTTQSLRHPLNPLLKLFPLLFLLVQTTLSELTRLFLLSHLDLLPFIHVYTFACGWIVSDLVGVATLDWFHLVSSYAPVLEPPVSHWLQQVPPPQEPVHAFTSEPEPLEDEDEDWIRTLLQSQTRQQLESSLGTPLWAIPCFLIFTWRIDSTLLTLSTTLSLALLVTLPPSQSVFYFFVVCTSRFFISCVWTFKMKTWGVASVTYVTLLISLLAFFALLATWGVLQ